MTFHKASEHLLYDGERYAVSASRKGTLVLNGEDTGAVIPCDAELLGLAEDYLTRRSEALVDEARLRAAGSPDRSRVGPTAPAARESFALSR